MALPWLDDSFLLPLSGLSGMPASPPVIGSGDPDVLEAYGTLRLVFGGGGNDIITTEAAPGGTWGNILFGGADSDSLTAIGDRNLVLGGTGGDFISLRGPLLEEGGVQNGLLNTAFGGSGDDVIRSYGFAATLHGGSGNDVLELDGYPGTGGFAYGDAGNDILSNRTDGGVLDGGAGSDILTGYNFAFQPAVGEGTVMTGGAGPDQFNIFGNSIPFVLYDGDGMLGRGDEVHGQFTVITDLTADDNVYLGNGILPPDRFEGELALQPYEWTPSTLLAPFLPIGSYTTVRGELYNPGSFAVREDGPDLLVLYVDRYIGRPGGEGPDIQPAHAAVALLDYSGDAVPLGPAFFGDPVPIG